MTLRIISENKNALSATLLYKVTAFGFVGSISFFEVGTPDYFLTIYIYNSESPDCLKYNLENGGGWYSWGFTGRFMASVTHKSFHSQALAK